MQFLPSLKALGFLAHSFMKIILSMLCIASATILANINGCTGKEETPSAKTTNTYAIVVGMGNSQFAGMCEGAGLDADRMFTLISKYTPNIVKLRDREATKANVVAALKNAIEKANNGLVIFSYSGHGGSDPFPDTGIEEDDGRDEYLCLWDTYLRDNEIWSIISKSHGRVFLLVDACHSRTMFRHASVKITPPLSFDHTLNEKHDFSMLCWSGCPDNTFSYGTSSGGQFTNALLRHIKDDKTYEELWMDIKNDRTLRAYENPQSTVIGNGFDGRMIFR